MQTACDVDFDGQGRGRGFLKCFYNRKNKKIEGSTRRPRSPSRGRHTPAAAVRHGAPPQRRRRRHQAAAEPVHVDGCSAGTASPVSRRLPDVGVFSGSKEMCLTREGQGSATALLRLSWPPSTPQPAGSAVAVHAPCTELRFGSANALLAVVCLSAPSGRAPGAKLGSGVQY